MRAGPPKVIEAVVALLVPPASREHVLGDLRERFAGTRSYLADAVSAVPGAIAGRMLRMVDWQVLALEAGALYLSFVTAAWSALGGAYLYRQGGFLRLWVPVVMTLAALVVGDVYDGGARFLPLVAAGLGVGGAAALAHARLALPAWILFSGGALGVAMISTVRIWFPPGGNRPRGEVL